MVSKKSASEENLRAALDLPDRTDRYKHREIIEGLKRTHPHTVAYRETVDEATCVTYTLKLFDDKMYRAIAGNFHGTIFAGRDFMTWLLHDHLQELNRPSINGIVLYFSEGIWQHIGTLVKTGRVISKWGTYPVYEHDVLELPARYGDTVRYFKAISPQDAAAFFLDFATDCGLSDRDIEWAFRRSN